MERLTTIYALCHPVTNEIRYVGKSINPNKRYQTHCNGKWNTHVSNWIHSLINKPIMIELEIVGDDWVEAEQFWISYFKGLGAQLTNLTVGGEGMIGYKATEETRKKLSEAAKASMTPERKAKICESNRGNTRFLGKTHTEEARVIMSRASIGNQNALGRKHTDEERTKLSLAAKRNKERKALASI